jgi:hypothetical protein
LVQQELHSIEQAGNALDLVNKNRGMVTVEPQPLLQLRRVPQKLQEGRLVSQIYFDVWFEAGDQRGFTGLSGAKEKEALLRGGQNRSKRPRNHVVILRGIMAACQRM